ncbi:putative MFS multidrug transporter [Ilyonectria destructans]|nr:putative MFS multidrug transporter [Ilyonectria destructans]
MPIVSANLQIPKVPSHPQETRVLEWEGPDDPGNPFNWPQRKKWLVTGLGLFATFISLVNGSIITVAHEAINQEFHVSDQNFPHSYWPVTSWALGGALFSLALLPIMEDFGIRYVFLITYSVFICFLVPFGVAKNFETIIITRFFTGGCVAILGNSVAGIISNTFQGDRSRTVPMSLYIAVYLIASSMGPVLGASIFQFLSWRWIGYIELIWTGALFPLFIVALPESRGSAILRNRAKKLRAKGQKTYTKEELDTTPLYQIVLKSMQRPLFMLCTEPVVSIATLWSAFSLGTIYLFTQSVEQVFGELYGWDAVQAGYLQAAIVTGDVLGWLSTLYTNKWYYNSAKRNTEIPNTPIPEARLYGALVGGFFGVSGGMFVYAWTSYPSIHWIAPAIGLAMVGFGTTAVVIGIANYLVDAYSIYAGSAVAAIGLGENVFIAFLPLAAQSMYATLGFHWASSLLGFVSLILAGAPIAVFIWGRQIRNRSVFMKESTEIRRVNSIALGNV